jgi:hypothetical protein
LLLVIAAFGIVASIFRAQSDRFLVRLSRSLVVPCRADRRQAMLNDPQAER